MQTITIRAARVDDSEAISLVLALNRNDPGLYQKSAAAVARLFSEFIVACDEAGEIIGCAALHRDSTELAEIYAIAVAPQLQGRGIGRTLMQACLQRAAESGLPHLWLATIKTAYFSRYGFQPISKWQLPLKTLLRKLRQTFQQPYRRWLPALIGSHTFMLRDRAL